jgi:hypothetical protein
VETDVTAAVSSTVGDRIVFVVFGGEYCLVGGVLVADVFDVFVLDTVIVEVLF